MEWSGRATGLGNSIKNQEMRCAAQAKINKVKATKGDGLFDRRRKLQLGNGQDNTIWDIKRTSGLKNKELVGMPWMLVFALRSIGWLFRQEISWEKPGPMPENATDRFTRSHEHVLFFVKKDHYFWNKAAAQEAGVSGSGDRNMRTVWTIPIERIPGGHTATFPTALVERMIRPGCPMGGTVLDPFGGSGTVGLVATWEQCNAVIGELWPPWMKLAQERIQQHAGLAAGVDWSYLLPKSGNQVRLKQSKKCPVALNSLLSV